MIYLKNASGLQEVLISRDEPFSGASGGGSCRQCYEEGEEHQKEKLSGITIESNGDYTRADGWSAVTVNVDEGQAYQEGFNDGYIEGRAFQKSLLGNLSVTENGTYSDEEGFATVDVNVPQGGSYESGYTDGFQSGFTSGFTSGYTDGLAEGYDIRSRMITSTGITENGTYTNVSGWSAVTVNVPQSGTTGTEIPLTGNTFSADSYGRYYFDYDQSTPISSITISFTVQPEPPVPPATSGDYLTFVAVEDGTFRYNATRGTNILSYSLDSGSNWISLNPQTDTPTVSAGNIVLWKGNCTTYNNEGTVMFYSTGKMYVEGNVMSLLFGDDFVDKVSLSGYPYCFRDLFRNTKTVNAEYLALPATTLSDMCYNGMFYECTTLEIAPSVLPATTLADYCYNDMFSGCTSLTTAPVLPATTLADYCYDYMFYGCTSLTTAPALPATTLAQGCYYYMFRDCTSLVSAPELPATTLTFYCYSRMFDGCTSLNYIKCLATDISATQCTNYWLNGVAASGTFVKASGVNWTTGNDGIPNGWTVQEV